MGDAADPPALLLFAANEGLTEGKVGDFVPDAFNFVGFGDGDVDCLGDTSGDVATDGLGFCDCFGLLDWVA